MSIFKRQPKFDPCKTMWIFNAEKSEVIPCVLSEDKSQVLVLNGTNLVLQNNAEIVKKAYGEGFQFLSYEEICSLYDYEYDNSADYIAEFKKEGIENGGFHNGDPESGFQKRYKYINLTTAKGMQKIANYLMENKKQKDSNTSAPQM